MFIVLKLDNPGTCDKMIYFCLNFPKNVAKVLQTKKFIEFKSILKSSDTSWWI